MPGLQYLFGGEETGYGSVFDSAVRRRRGKPGEGIRGGTNQNIKLRIGRNGRKIPGGSQGDYQTKKSESMNSATELTAADLALYLGCECQASTRTGTIDIVNCRGFCIVSDGVYSWSEPIRNIKPILRPLSDMTEEEMREKHEAYLSACKSLGLLAHGTAADTRYLLSHHFDLFGWIPAGLAIDKTKTVTP